MGFLNKLKRSGEKSHTKHKASTVVPSVYVENVECEEGEEKTLIELAKLVARIPSPVARYTVRQFMRSAIQQYLCDRLVLDEEWELWIKNAKEVREGKNGKVLVAKDDGIWLCEKGEGYWRCNRWD